MSHEQTHDTLRVTAQERTHPALRKLATACLALARLELAAPAGTGPLAAAGICRNGGRHD